MSYIQRNVLAWGSDVLREKRKGVFTTFMDNHDDDGELAVWLPAPAGLQAALIDEGPDTCFKPP